MGSLSQSPTMASRSAQFFLSGTSKQFDFVLNKYQEALQAKADSKNSKSEVLLKLDKWYQNELPKKIKSRGKEGHMTHEELVQLIKWKLARGKFRPRLKDLIQMNTPRVVMQETKKAFRAIDKRKDLEGAVNALSNLKGVGPAMASAVLSAMAPELAPFMADELLLSMPEVEGIDYTMKEYMKLVDQTKQCVERLNAQGGEWTPHKVEMAVWTYYILRDLKPEALENLPEASDRRVATEAESPEAANGNNGVNGETPVENGNGLEASAEHSEKSEEVTPTSESAAKRPLAEPEEAGSEAKRICSSEAEEAQAETIVAEAPNGVNSTPHPITSGGD